MCSNAESEVMDGLNSVSVLALGTADQLTQLHRGMTYRLAQD